MGQLNVKNSERFENELTGKLNDEVNFVVLVSFRDDLIDTRIPKISKGFNWKLI